MALTALTALHSKIQGFFVLFIGFDVKDHFGWLGTWLVAY
jgi:hypothetical protein